MIPAREYLIITESVTKIVELRAVNERLQRVIAAMNKRMKLDMGTPRRTHQPNK